MLSLNVSAFTSNNLSPAPPCSLSVNAGTDKLMCAGSSTVLTANITGGTAPYTYSWTPAGSLSSSSSSSPVAFPASTTTYTVTVTDVNSCSATDVVTVTVVPSGDLVTNGDFEIGFPFLRGDIELAAPWKKATGDADLFSVFFGQCPLNLTLLPDLCTLSPVDYTCIGIPCNHFGFQDVRKPGTVNYAGLWAGAGKVAAEVTNPPLDQALDIAVEGIEISLGTTLVPGETYRLTFYISRAEKGEVDVQVAPFAQYKVKLAPAFTSNDLYQPVNAPVLLTDTISDPVNWKKVTHIFTATAASTHLIIESSIDLLADLLLDPGSLPATFTNLNINADNLKNKLLNGEGLQSYFYIDDISLKYDCESDTILIADAGPDKYICKGDPVTIGGSPTAIAGTPPYTYYWPQGGYTSANPSVSPNTHTTYTVIVTDVNGLTATDQMTVYVSDMSFDAGPPSKTICSHSPTMIGSTPNGGIEPYSYSWSPSAGLNYTNIAQPTATLTSTTTYIVTVTDAAGCIRKDTITLNVIPNQNTSAGSDQTICPGSSATLTATTTSGQSPYFHKWSTVGGPIFAYGNSTSVSPVSTTDYVLTAEDARGCVRYDTVRVNVRPKPQLNVTDQQRCSGSPGVLIGSAATGSTPPYTYSWSHGLGNAAQHTVSPLSTTTYTVTVTDANGCTNTKEIKVTVHPLPGANAGRDKTICLGGSTKIGGKHTGSGEAGFTYSWSPATGLDDPSKDIPTANPLVTTTYIVTVTNVNGCQAKDTMILTVLNTCAGGGEVGVSGCNGIPEVNAGEDHTVCTGTSDTLKPVVTGGKTPYTYLWSPATGLNSTTSANPIVTNITRQTYKVIVTDACGQKSQDIITVTMKSPNLPATPDAEICGGSSISIGQPATGGTPPYTYSWTASTGTAPGGTPPQSVAPLTNTTYILTVTDNIGCVDKDTIVISVLPVLAFSAGPDKNYCTNTTPVSIGNNATGGTPGYTYSWYPTRGLSPNASSATPTANPQVTTTYMITVTDSKGCSVYDEVTVYVSDPPYVPQTTDKTICRDEVVSIGHVAQGGTPGYTYAWAPVTGLASPASAVTNASPLTTTTYILTATDSRGCIGKDTVLVTVKSTPVANAGPDKSICEGDSVTIGVTATGGVAPLTYSWHPATGLSNASVATPKASPPSTTIYTVTVTGANLCTDQDMVEVQVFNTPEYVPNGGFEDGAEPILRGDIAKAFPWETATGDPDLYDADDTTCSGILILPATCSISPLDYNCIGIPCNHFGNQQHHLPNGERYAGLWSAFGLQPMVRVDQPPANPFIVNETFAVEGMIVKLGQKLTPGREYRLSFRASLAEKGETENLPPTLPLLGTENWLRAPAAPLMAKFSTIPRSNTLFRPIKDTYDPFFAVVTDTANWVNLTNTFIADSAYEYLIIESDPAAFMGFGITSSGNQLASSDFIGNNVYADLLVPSSWFFSPAFINTSQPLEPFYYLQSYCYIDDVSIKEECDVIPPLIVDAGRDTTICDGQSVMLGGNPTASYGTPGYTYSWTGPSFSSALPNPPVTPQAGTNTYTVTVSDAGGQVKSDQVTIIVYTQQQHIINGDFEAGTMPQLRTQIERAPDWFKATGDADLFDSLVNCDTIPCGLTPADFNCVDIPCNHFGNQGIRSTGQRYAGLWSAIQLSSAGRTNVIIETPKDATGTVLPGGTTIGDPNTTSQIAVEGIEIELTQALDTNRYYEMSFYLSKAERGETGDNPTQLPPGPGQIDTKHLLVDDCAGYRVKFSIDGVTNILFQPVPRPSVDSGQVCDTVNWELKSFSFRPTDTFKYVIIESYPTDGARIKLSPGTGSAGPGGPGGGIDTSNTPYTSGFQSYFYIDDVSLREVCGQSSQAMRMANQQPVNPVVKKQYIHAEGLNMQIAPNPNNGTFMVTCTIGEQSEKLPEIILYDAIGKVLSRKQIGYGQGIHTIEMNPGSTGGELIPGIYFVRFVNGYETIVKRVSVIK